MKNTEFKRFLSEVPNFSNLQFRLLKEKIQQRVKKKRVSNILETEEFKLNCPFCKSKQFIKWGKRSDLQRYKCKSCCKTFNSLTKTPLAKLKRKGHWLSYSHCLKRGFTLKKSAEICGIHINTAFRWRHRFLCNSKFIKAKKIGGIIESAHLVLKESFKGVKKFDKDKKENLRDVYVVYGMDRNNNMFDLTDKGFNVSVLRRWFGNIVQRNSLLISGGNKNYSDFAYINGIKHTQFNSQVNDLFFKDGINSYLEKFKRWINNHFKGVSTKYLENYVSWYRSLSEFRSGITALTILYRAKSIEKYRHQPEKVKRFL
ncbi:MAG: IS1595 family transposase [Marinifilaceae bacterium]|jgi:transposase-like protein/DNA-binding CsgD family transcriptional regulator|nr:IS1595 family transposase [Marinifilaceae bacterium]